MTIDDIKIIFSKNPNYSSFESVNNRERYNKMTELKPLTVSIETIAKTYQESLVLLEQYWLSTLMKKNKYNQSKTAKDMGISRANVRIKLKKHFGTEYFRDAQ